MNAGADAILASLNPVIPSPQISNPAPGAASLTTGPSGATASTGGFVNAGHEAHPAPLSSTTAASSAGNTSTEGKGFLSSVFDTIGVTNSTAAFGSPLAGAPGGGLASSPNVPRAGSSIDPATGKPHTAGLTRAELEAKKAKVLNDAVVSHSGTAGSSGSNLSDLSGREQAAAQLNASFITVPGGGIAGITNTAVITPGPQVPGAWGDQRQAPLPGTNKDAVTSVYDDVTDGLEKLGTAAYNLIPKSIKDAINNDALDKGKQPEGQPPQNRRSSVTALFEQAKHSGEKLVHDARESINSGRRESLKGTQTRAPGTIGSEGSVFSLVKSFVGDIANSGEAQIKATGLTEKKTTLPSEEILGTQPGDKTAGVGALPGLATEQGVAVLPDEKTNQGTLPGEVLATSAPSATTASAHRDVGLAPALPATVLGAGAAKGATDLEVAGLSPSTSQTTGDAATLSSINTESSSTSVETGNLSPTRHAADRTNSAASITAIRGGHEGAKPSPLAHSTLATDASTASVPEVEEKDNGVSNSTAGALSVATGGAVAGAAIVTGQKSTTRGTGDEHTTSLTPGDETAGVGHPDSRGQNGTSREPGTYPKANHDGPATGLDEKAAKPSAITTANHGKEEKTEQPSAPAGDGRVVAPKIEEIEDHPGKVGTTIGAATGGQSPTSGKGHNRTGSTDSSGKKKVGFMSKLKGEIKVIGGKIQHDEKKIAEGEKLKHGEL